MTQGMSLVTFETRDIEDRDASSKAGHYVGRDIDVAMITPIGGQLVVDKLVDDTLLNEWKSNPALRYRYDAYCAWKQGEEAPINGHPLKMWPPISPAQLKVFTSRNIHSVQELSELPDTALPAFGPGSRNLRDKARDWLKSAESTGVIVEEVNQLRQELADRDLRDAKKDEVIAKLQKQVDQLIAGQTQSAA